MADSGSGGGGSRLGGRVAPAITRHVVDAVVATRVAMKGHLVDTFIQAQDQFFRITGEELRRSAGPILDALAKDPDTGDLARPLFQFTAAGKGQLATMLGHTFISQAAATGLGALLTNELQVVTGRLIAQNPSLPLSPADSARAAVTGQTFGLDAAYEAAQQGIEGRKFNILKALATEQLDPGTVVELYRRGEMNQTDAVGRLQLIGHTFENAHAILSTGRVLLTPAALADMVVRGIMTEGDATHVAAQNGVTGDDFRALILDSGEPPGIQDLLFANRRGTIGDDRLVHGIRQSRVRDEWIDVIKSLSHQPMSTADAIEAAVQGHVTLDQSRTIASQNGLLPEHWQALYDTAGNPPGVQEMVSMWHRGKLTKDELLQGIRESRLKNKYIQAVIDASETLPPERSIVSMVTKGGLTAAQGLDLLLKRGYAPDIAQALIDEAHLTKTQKQRELTASQIVALYEDSALSVAQATDLLVAMGYDDATAAQELSLADLRRLKKFTDAIVSKLRSLYVAGKIDQSKVATELDALHVAADQRDMLLQLWDIERGLLTKELTLAQLEAAAKKQIITAGEFHDRVLALGYSEDDVLIIMQLIGFTVT